MVLVRCWLGTLPTNPSLQYRACLKMRSNTFFCNLALLSQLQPPWQWFVNDFRAVCGCASLSQGKNSVTATEAAVGCHSCAHKKSHNGVALVWPNLISGLPPPPLPTSQHVLHLAQHLEVKPLEYHMNSAMGTSFEWCSNKNSDREKKKRSSIWDDNFYFFSTSRPVAV